MSQLARSTGRRGWAYRHRRERLRVTVHRGDDAPRRTGIGAAAQQPTVTQLQNALGFRGAGCSASANSGPCTSHTSTAAAIASRRAPESLGSPRSVSATCKRATSRTQAPMRPRRGEIGQPKEASLLEMARRTRRRVRRIAGEASNEDVPIDERRRLCCLFAPVAYRAAPRPTVCPASRLERSRTCELEQVGLRAMTGWRPWAWNEVITRFDGEASRGACGIMIWPTELTRADTSMAIPCPTHNVGSTERERPRSVAGTALRATETPYFLGTPSRRRGGGNGAAVLQRRSLVAATLVRRSVGGSRSSGSDRRSIGVASSPRSPARVPVAVRACDSPLNTSSSVASTAARSRSTRASLRGRAGGTAAPSADRRPGDGAGSRERGRSPVRRDTTEPELILHVALPGHGLPAPVLGACPEYAHHARIRNRRGDQSVGANVSRCLGSHACVTWTPCRWLTSPLGLCSRLA